MQLGDRLEFWPTNSAESVGSHFVSIAALYTELVAINSRGELHQWKWQSPEPFNPHVRDYLLPDALHAPL